MMDQVELDEVLTHTFSKALQVTTRAEIRASMTQSG